VKNSGKKRAAAAVPPPAAESPHDDARRRRRLFWIVLLLFGCALRCRELLAPLAYDEIWSLQQYAPLGAWRILTDLALPNNHPLNSFYLKLLTVFAAPISTLRLHSFLAGVLSIPLAGAVAFGVWRSRRAAAAAALFLTFSAPAIAYSQLARGYGMQLMFLLLYSFGIAWSGGLRRLLPGRRFLPECAVLVGAAGAMLSLPSSPIFLVAATVAGIAAKRSCRYDRRSVAAVAAAAALSLLYLGINFTALRSGQAWGEAFTGVGSFLAFCGRTWRDLVPFSLLPLLLAAVVLSPRRSMPLLLAAALILLSALATRGGPSRVYLPLAALAAILAGGGAAAAVRKVGARHRRLCAFFVLALALGGYCELAPRWREPDWHAIFAASRKLPADTLIVYRATSGLPLVWNNQPAIFEDYLARLTAPTLRRLAVDAPAGEINGMIDNGEEHFTLSFPGRELPVGDGTMREYRLREIAAADPALRTAGTPLLAVLPPGPPERRSLVLDSLRRCGRFLELDPWLNLMPPGGALAAAGIMADPAAGALLAERCGAASLRLFVIEAENGPARR